MKRRVTIAVSVSLCLLAVGGLLQRARDRFNGEVDNLVLLVPDGTDFSDPLVTVWLDAASEEGLHVIPMSDSSFLRPRFRTPRYAGVILPDTVHEQASDLLIGVLRKYVATGGNLMLAYDAGTKSLNGFYAADRSRLSDLAGVNYALYQALGNGDSQ